MLPKTYNPQETEDRIYKMWEESGVFRADRDSKKEPFTVSMPPPNATGNLHLGHAVMLALEDIFIRFARMRGKEALWIPGTDHAAIATESVVIRELRKEGMQDPRRALGREELVARIAAYVEQSRGTIRSQVRKMGASCDWSRERYTMDPQLNRCVNEVFKRMYDDGLIYRGHRIVNWDPKLQTTVSDDEVDWKEEAASFYTFRYGPFQISTARPETKFGDKYVVMHPDDERYGEYADGQTFACEWINGPIRATVIKDTAVDPAFGTGCMTITPWHDAADFDIAERHGLEKEQIIGFDGRLLPIAGEFAGQTIEEARPKIVWKLQKKGLLVQTDPAYVHRKAVSQRGGGTIEPQIKLQWFIDVHRPAVLWKGKKMSLKEVMHDVIHHGDIAIIPERFSKVYFHWIDNLRDWCISRQIWWGHRVPVYYCGRCAQGNDNCRGERRAASGERSATKLPARYPLPASGGGSGVIISAVPVAKCPKCGGLVEQDPDTLDTWFSSALWTWSTLVDPKVAEKLELTLEQILERSPDYRRFHPTTVMETGYDILFFWVARMILMTTYATGQVPFKTVYLHGLVRTRDGKKMSKSDPRTTIDPLDMIAKYGADALRLSMIVGQAPGADARLYEEKIAGYRNFVNKLWNASRFALLQCENSPDDSHKDPKKMTFDHFEDPAIFQGNDYGVLSQLKLSPADEFILSELQDVIADVTDKLIKYSLSEVGERLYSFLWNDFCDWYLESRKIYGNDTSVLIYVLKNILKLLHPYCPFVTEELWSQFASPQEGMLISQQWPSVSLPLRDWLAKRQSSQKFRKIIDVVSTIRSLRAEHGIDPKAKIVVEVRPFDRILEIHMHDIKRLANLEHLHGPGSWIGGAPSASLPQRIVNGMHIVLVVSHAYDPDQLRRKLVKEKENLENYIKTIEGKLKNKKFVDNAPEEVVNTEKEKLATSREKLKKVEERLRTF